DLRGIDPKETLILQDGRRLANVGFAGSSADFNIFPLGLIDHIDILKDGASPVYGTDAVAGVLNVLLIHRFRGLEVYASYGNTILAAVALFHVNNWHSTSVITRRRSQQQIANIFMVHSIAIFATST